MLSATSVDAENLVMASYKTTVTRSERIIRADADKLATPIAAAILRAIATGITGISERAAPATLRARDVGARAAAKGKTWAIQRYPNGERSGANGRVWNDSGELAREMHAVASGRGERSIVAPRNRFQDGRGAALLADLVSRLPMLRSILDQPTVRAAIARANESIVSFGPRTETPV